MPEKELDAACKDQRLLIFPGTQVLHKQLLPCLPPKQGTPMTSWAGEPAGPLTHEQNPADLASESQQAPSAEAVTSSLQNCEAKAAGSTAAAGAAKDMVLPVQTQQDSAHIPPTTAAPVGVVIQVSVKVYCSYPQVHEAVHGQRSCDMQVPNPCISPLSCPACASVCHCHCLLPLTDAQYMIKCSMCAPTQVLGVHHAAQLSALLCIAIDGTSDADQTEHCVQFHCSCPLTGCRQYGTFSSWDIQF